MAKTKIDIVTEALRHLGVISKGEPAPPEDLSDGLDVLSAVSAEMEGTQGLTMPADLDVTPDGVYLPLSRVLAAELQDGYELVKVRRSGAVARLRAALLDNDLPLRGDYDDDGVVSEEEAYLAKRAVYF